MYKANEKDRNKIKQKNKYVSSSCYQMITRGWRINRYEYTKLSHYTQWTYSNEMNKNIRRFQLYVLI